MDCSPPGSSVLGISQARILEWVAIPCSKGSSQPRDQTTSPVLADEVYHRAAREAPAPFTMDLFSTCCYPGPCWMDDEINIHTQCQFSGNLGIILPPWQHTLWAISLLYTATDKPFFATCIWICEYTEKQKVKNMLSFLSRSQVEPLLRSLCNYVIQMISMTP